MITQTSCMGIRDLFINHIHVSLWSQRKWFMTTIWSESNKCIIICMCIVMIVWFHVHNMHLYSHGSMIACARYIKWNTDSMVVLQKLIQKCILFYTAQNKYVCRRLFAFFDVLNWSLNNKMYIMLKRVQFHIQL